MDDMYRELIIEHYKNPSYKGKLDPCDHAYEDENPSCGDELRIMLNVDENNIITDARFQGAWLCDLPGFRGPAFGGRDRQDRG